MRYYREARRWLPEHPGDASPYLGIARKFLGILLRQMQFQGLRQLVWKRILADGTIIRVGSIYGLQFIDIQPAIEDDEILQRGFICLPESDSETLPETVIYGESGDWNAQERDGLVYGNVDWRGPDGLVLSWQGPRGRYRGGDPAGSQPNIYYNGAIVATVPNYPSYDSDTNLRIAGAAVATFSEEQHLVCIITNNLEGYAYAFRRPWRPGGYDNSDMFNAVTNPLGWVLLGSRTNPDGMRGQSFFFFNESGTEAVSVGYKLVPVLFQPDTQSSWRTRASINENNAFFFNFEHGAIERETSHSGTDSTVYSWSVLDTLYFYDSPPDPGSPRDTTDSLITAQNVMDQYVTDQKDTLYPIGSIYGVDLFVGQDPRVPGEDYGYDELLSVSWTKRGVLDDDIINSNLDGDPVQGHVWRDEYDADLLWSTQMMNEDGEFTGEPGPDTVLEQETAIVTEIEQWDRLERTRVVDESDTWTGTFSGEYLEAADYQGDTLVQGAFVPSGTQSYHEESETTRIDQQSEINEPDGDGSWKDLNFVSSSGTSSTTGSSSYTVMYGSMEVYTDPASYDSGTIVTGKPLFWDLRTGTYVLAKTEQTSGDTQTDTLQVYDGSTTALDSKNSSFNWTNTDYDLFGNQDGKTEVYFDGPEWFSAPLVSIEGSLTTAPGGAAANADGALLCSYRIDDVFSAGENNYNYLTGGDLTTVTALAGDDPHFYPLGII